MPLIKSKCLLYIYYMFSHFPIEFMFYKIVRRFFFFNFYFFEELKWSCAIAMLYAFIAAWSIYVEREMWKEVRICHVFCGCVMCHQYISLKKKNEQTNKQEIRKKRSIKITTTIAGKVNSILRSSLFWFGTTVSNKLNEYTWVNERMCWRHTGRQRERKQERTKREYSIRRYCRCCIHASYFILCECTSFVCV